MYFQSIEREIAVNLISLQTEFSRFNSYLQRLFLTFDSNDYILRPIDALRIAEDFKELIKFKWRLDNQTVNYLNETQSNFFSIRIMEIVSSYRAVMEAEKENGGNLYIAHRIVNNGDKNEFDSSIFNYNGNTIKDNILKNLKGV